MYGILYLHLITIPLLYGPESVYGLFSYRWQKGLTGLAYLGSGVGIVVGTVICSRYLNRSYAYMQKRQLRSNGSNEHIPEHRLPFLQLGMTIVPIGLAVFAWTAEKRMHWVLPLVGAATFSTGMLMAYVCIQTYIVDVYNEHGASALAAVILARCTTSCVFSVTGFQLYENLGYAWYDSCLYLGNPYLLTVDLLQGHNGDSIRLRWYVAYPFPSLHVRRPPTCKIIHTSGIAILDF